METEDERIAQGRRDRIKEKGPTNLYLIKDERINPAKPEIMLGARDKGPAVSLARVMEKLLEKGYPLSILVDKPAEDFIKEKFTVSLKELKPSGEKNEEENEEHESPLLAVGLRNPALILSGISASDPDVRSGTEFFLAKTSERKIPTVWVEDFWGVATRQRQLTFNVWPTAVCAFDEASKQVDIENLRQAGRFDVPEESFVVTGSPAFDEIYRENDMEEIRRKVREELGIENNDIMLVFMGQLPPSDLENFRLLIESLNRIDTGQRKIKFIARAHPAIFTGGELSKYRSEYENLLQGLTSADVVNTMGKFSTDEVAKACDAIVTGYSTEGVKGVYRKKLVMFMLLPSLDKDSLKRETGMDNLPVVESGAALGVFQTDSLQANLEKLLLDESTQKNINDAQERHHRLDGKNTERVLAVVEKLI